jgi:hypothetical protein
VAQLASPLVAPVSFTAPHNALGMLPPIRRDGAANIIL